MGRVDSNSPTRIHHHDEPEPTAPPPMTSPNLGPYRQARPIVEEEPTSSTLAWERYRRVSRSYTALPYAFTVVFPVFVVLGSSELAWTLLGIVVVGLVLRLVARNCECPECRRPITGTRSTRSELALWLGVFPARCVCCDAERSTRADVARRKRESEGRGTPLTSRMAARIPGFFLAAVCGVGAALFVEYEHSTPPIAIEASVGGTQVREVVSIGRVTGFRYVDEHAEPPSVSSGPRHGSETMRANRWPF